MASRARSRRRLKASTSRLTVQRYAIRGRVLGPLCQATLISSIQSMSLGSADAVVIGGGVIGCSIAYHLARRGAHVVVVERDALGSQSTGRCAGGVRRQFSSETNVLMQQLSIRLLAGFESETGVDPEFRQIGYLFVLTNDHQIEDFKRLLTMWLRLGVSAARWVEPLEVRELAPGV